MNNKINFRVCDPSKMIPAMSFYADPPSRNGTKLMDESNLPIKASVGKPEKYFYIRLNQF